MDAERVRPEVGLRVGEGREGAGTVSEVAREELMILSSVALSSDLLFARRLKRNKKADDLIEIIVKRVKTGSLPCYFSGKELF